MELHAEYNEIITKMVFNPRLPIDSLRHPDGAAFRVRVGAAPLRRCARLLPARRASLSTALLRRRCSCRPFQSLRASAKGFGSHRAWRSSDALPPRPVGALLPAPQAQLRDSMAERFGQSSADARYEALVTKVRVHSSDAQGQVVDARAGARSEAQPMVYAQAWLVRPPKCSLRRSQCCVELTCCRTAAPMLVSAVLPCAAHCTCQTHVLLAGLLCLCR